MSKNLLSNTVIRIEEPARIALTTNKGALFISFAADNDFGSRFYVLFWLSRSMERPAYSLRTITFTRELHDV